MGKIGLFIKMLFIALCALAAVSFVSTPVRAHAEGRLSVSDTKVWINGSGSITVTYKDHDNEKIKLDKTASKYATIKAGKWKGDKAVIKIEALADKNTKLNITVGDETVTVKLYLLKAEVRSSEDVYPILKDAMVEIRCVDSKNNVYIGSGFFIGNGLVLTNQHVVEAATDITITDYYGDEHLIKKIYGVSAEKDLIVFKVSGSHKGALTIADSVQGGERIYNIGSPAGLTGSFVTGVVANEGYEIDKTHYIQLSMPTGIGSGGGPIVNAKGQVLGVMTLVVNAAQNITMAVDFTEINAFLKSLKSSDRMSLSDFYETTAGKVKESNDYQIFKGLSDENTSKTYAGFMNELTPEEIYARAFDACVDIVVYADEFGNGGSGSGFFIDENTIITNQHVIDFDNPKTITITDYNNNEYIIQNRRTDIKSSKEYDVAVITVTPKDPGAKHGFLETATGYIPAVGEVLYGMGSPAGYSCTFSEGLVTMSTRMLDNLEFINTSVPITPGSSGGPLLNRYGQVIGINSRVINVVRNSNLAIPVKYVSYAK